MAKEKITVAQIAKASGVSPATVSRVLNHRELVKSDTVNLVKDAMLKLGYDIEAFNKVPVKEEQQVIVLCIPNSQNAFYNELIRGAQISAKAHNCFLLIYESPIDSGTIQTFCNLLHRISATGVITFSRISTTSLDQIRAIVPLVQCCEYNSNSSCPYVSIDDFAAAKCATEHLISCGRNKIAFVNGPRSYKFAEDRQNGFVDSMINADLFIPQNWMVQLPELNYEMAYAAICRILNSESIPNAFFVTSDIFALAVVQAARYYRLKVPRDIMVVGFDNIDFSMMTSPSITTINPPRFQMGYTACEMLIEIILTPSDIPNSILFETELVIRDSTATNLSNQNF